MGVPIVCREEEEDVCEWSREAELVRALTEGVGDCAAGVIRV